MICGQTLDRRRRLLAARLMEPTDRTAAPGTSAPAPRRGDGGGSGCRTVRRTLGDLTGSACCTCTAARARRPPSSRSSAPSSPASTSRRRRSRRRASAGPTIVWLQADVQTLPAQLRRRRFDLVYTGEGVLAGCRPRRVGGGIAAALRRGGELLIYEEHPSRCASTGCCAGARTTSTSQLHVYKGWSHFELGGAPPSEEKVERIWRLGQVVSAIARSGLPLQALEEYPGGLTSRRRHDSSRSGGRSCCTR